MIYLDNNATTIVPPNVIRTIVNWINKGNPSADYASAGECKKMMKEFREYLASRCKFINYEPDTKYKPSDLKKVYHIVFTSGASESNNYLLRSVVKSYRFHKKGVIPHIITSAIEHKSIINCAQDLVSMNQIELTIINPDNFGFIDPEDVRKAIRPNTCLISIMSANNETGAINNIKKIGEIAHASQVPFHTDAVQTFGKFLISPVEFNVDAFSVSFHKLHGDKGVGLLVIRKQFVDGYKLLPEICGSQNCGLRGGTENISGIAGAYEATKLSWANRVEKNNTMLSIKKRMIELMIKKVPSQTYREYLESPLKTPIQLVFLSTTEKTYLPNTLLLSVVKRTKPDMCNIDLKKQLEANGVIVSIGSACNTSSSKASHVLSSMGVDMLIRRGTIRISLGDENRLEEADSFVNILVKILRNIMLAQ